MQFGIFPTEGGSFDGLRDEARLAEDVGFDSYWVCEHHVAGENYWPAPLVRLANVAAVTDDLDLVTAVVLPPLHNAVELAEKCATLDRLSDGRLTVGAGLGYVPAEFEAYGVSMDDRAGRFVESLRFLDAYLSAEEPISFESEFWSVEDLHPNPTAAQDPRPPIWVGGWGDLALQRAARLGDAWLPGGTASLDQLVERQARLRDHVQERGGEWDETAHPLMREVIVAETSAEAERLCETYLARTYAEEYGSESWSHPLIKDEDAGDVWSLAEERFLVGTPAQVVEQIETFRDRMTLDHVGCRFHHPGMPADIVRRQIELFGDEVLPAFQ